MLRKEVKNLDDFLKLLRTQFNLPAGKGYELAVKLRAGIPVESQKIVGLGQIDLKGIELTGSLQFVSAAMQLQGVGDQTLIAFDVVAA